MLIVTGVEIREDFEMNSEFEEIEDYLEDTFSACYVSTFLVFAFCFF